MEINLDQKLQTWLDRASVALLLFREKTLVGFSPYAQKLLPGIEIGMAQEELLGQEAEEELELYSEGTMLIPLELMGLRYDGKFSLLEGDLVLELMLPEMALSASALRSMAEGLAGPLTAVMSLLPKLLPQLEENDKNMERAAQVNKGLYAMNRAVSNIRFAAEEQGLQPTLRRCDLTTWLHELTQRLQDMFSLANRVFQPEVPEKPIMCDVDLRLLERALVNVISNAIKFSEPGTEIRLSVGKLGSRIRITVRDQGCGIPAWQMGNVFCQKEHREPVPDPRQGIGLGLGMARRILQVHGGNLLLESQEGKGTAVHLMLPVSQNHTTLPLATKVFFPDYAGGYNKLLLELSDVLPKEAFDTRGIDL